MSDWKCLRCGTEVEGPLTDDTTCECRDIYDPEWVLVQGCPHEQLNEDGICRQCGEDMRRG